MLDECKMEGNWTSLRWRLIKTSTELETILKVRRTNQHRRLMAARVAGGRQLWEMLDELEEEHNENSYNIRGV